MYLLLFNHSYVFWLSRPYSGIALILYESHQDCMCFALYQLSQDMY